MRGPWATSVNANAPSRPRLSISISSAFLKVSARSLGWTTIAVQGPRERQQRIIVAFSVSCGCADDSGVSYNMGDYWLDRVLRPLSCRLAAEAPECDVIRVTVLREHREAEEARWAHRLTPLPVKFEVQNLKDFAQLGERYDLARPTHQVRCSCPTSSCVVLCRPAASRVLPRRPASCHVVPRRATLLVPHIGESSARVFERPFRRPCGAATVMRHATPLFMMSR